MVGYQNPFVFSFDVQTNHGLVPFRIPRPGDEPPASFGLTQQIEPLIRLKVEPLKKLKATQAIPETPSAPIRQVRANACRRQLIIMAETVPLPRKSERELSEASMKPAEVSTTKTENPP